MPTDLWYGSALCRLWFNLRYVTNVMGKAEMATYCLFPKEGDPAVVTRPGHSLAGAMLARTVVRNIIVGQPSVLDAIVNEIKERAYDNGRVGVVEYDPYTSIPKNHWDFFTANLPGGRICFCHERVHRHAAAEKAPRKFNSSNAPPSSATLAFARCKIGSNRHDRKRSVRHRP